MTIAVVVVAPAAVIETAKMWARFGLVADSLWVSADDLTGIDLDKPNDLVATYLSFEEEPLDGPLAVQLAELGSLDEARMAWVRYPGAADESQLQALDELARDLLPYDQVHWLDIVAPQRRTDGTAVPLAGKWTQYRIHPSDRPAPDVTDAGWDLGRPVPLHATLALTGILGGTMTALPWARLNAAQNWVVRVFSRMVDGGLEARRQSWRFVLNTMPAATAAELHPADYLQATAAESAQVVDSAATWILETCSGALSYVPPPTSAFNRHPRLSVGRHLLNFARFLPIGFEAIFGVHRDSGIARRNLLESEDLGYSVGQLISGMPVTNGIPDFLALEAAAASRANDELLQLRTREGAQPSTEVWEPVAQVVTSLVDCGSSLPGSWIPPIRHDHRLSVSPAVISLGAAQAVTSDTPELALADNLAAAAEAVRAARSSTGPALRPGSESTVVTATVLRLVRQGNEQDSAELQNQLEMLDLPPAPAPGSRSLLERVRGSVIGGLLRSRLDAERWGEAAVRSPEGLPPTWDRPSRKFRRIWWVAAALCLVAGVLWSLFHDDINDVLATALNVWEGVAVISALTLLALLIVLYFFFRAWNAFLERGRRRLEMMAIWLERAAQAWSSHATLVNAERVSRAWACLLSSFLPEGGGDQATRTDIEIEGLPFSMRVGHPRFREEQLRGWLAEIGAQPGWRLACLRRLVGNFLVCDDNRALQEISRDMALSGGKLDRLTSALPDLIAEWREDAVTAIWNELRERIAEHSDRIEVPRSQGLPPSATRLRPFLAELTPDDGEQRWSHEHLLSSTTTVPDNDSLVLVVTPALTAASVRIQIQLLDDPALLCDHDKEDADSEDQSPR